MKPSKPYIVDSVDSALGLLSLIAEHPALGVTELAQRTGLNKSRAYRMLCTLEAHRFVLQDEKTAAYSLGPQAFVIGVAATQQNTLARCAQKHMLALNQQIDETVVLRVREALETVCVLRYESTREVRPLGAVGNRRPVYAGASGKVLLAWAPDTVRSQYLSKIRQKGQLPSASSAVKIHAELDTVVRRGYAASVGELSPGIVALAVPVRDFSGDTIASLSVSGPETRLPTTATAAIVERLLATSRAISAELGYSA
jgi:DNA-binding IclR family transcriptional regulator